MSSALGGRSGLEESDLLDTCWDAGLWVARLLWAVGLGLCLVEALSPLAHGSWRVALLISLVFAAAGTAWTSRRLQRRNLPASMVTEFTAFLLGFLFGLPALVFVAGSLIFMTLRLRTLNRIGYRHPWAMPAVFSLGVFYGPLVLSTLVWLGGPAYATLLQWAGRHGASFPSTVSFGMGWYLPIVLALLGVIILGCSIVLAIWWGRVLRSALDVDLLDLSRRRRLAGDFEAIIHDGALDLFERLAAGQSASAVDRRRLANLSLHVRSQLLDDFTPRTIEGFASQLKEDCNARKIFASITEYSEGDPPAKVLEVFKLAAGALISNLKHAHIDRVTLTLTSSRQRMSLALRDEGAGFDPENAIWSPHTNKYVFQALAELDPAGRPVVVSAPQRGTTWSLLWPIPDSP